MPKFKDPVIARLAKHFGELEFRVHQQDRFAEIVDSIVSQQLSGKVASIIYSRLEKLCGKITPQTIMSTEHSALRACGPSNAKVTYIKDLAEKTANGTLQLNKLDTMSDAEVIEHLVIVKGIGPWTAEMILMFSLNRPDVFSVDDLGIQNAMIRLYGLKRTKKFKDKLIKISNSWKPHRTLACRYLWKSLDNK